MTPGKWQVVYLPDEPVIHVQAVDDTPNDELTVAMCVGPQRGENARAIASLPELVAIVKKLARLKTGPRQSDRGEWLESVLAMAEESRNVLAKLSGR